MASKEEEEKALAEIERKYGAWPCCVCVSCHSVVHT